MTIESRQSEPLLDTTHPKIEAIQKELVQYNIRLSTEQQAKLRSLSENDIALIHQELIALGNEMEKISEWVKKLDAIALEQPLEQNG